MFVSNELLNRLVVAQVTEIAEDWHEALGLEGFALDVDVRRWVRGICDAFVLYLVGEEGSDDRQEARDYVEVANYVQSCRRYCE